VSGSDDGKLCFWKLSSSPPTTLSLIFAVPVVGVVNGLALSKSGKFCVAAVGKEHRFGRWFTVPQAKNGICIIPLMN